MSLQTGNDSDANGDGQTRSSVPDIIQTHGECEQEPKLGPNSKKQRLSSSAFTRRKRAVTACHFCRLRKAKCDAVRPVCGFCRHHNAKCAYDGRDVDAFVDGSESRNTELSDQILDRLSEIKVLLQNNQNNQHPQLTAEPAAISPSLIANSPLLNPRVENGSSQLWSSHPHLQPPYPATKCESILRWPVFSNIIHETDADIQSFIFSSDADEVSGCGSALAYAFNTHNISHSSPLTVDEDAVVPLCRNFLIYVYPRNPILDKEELINYAKDVAANGLKWNASSCLVLLACALACYAQPWQPEQVTPTRTDSRLDASDIYFSNLEDIIAAEAYYKAAKKRIGLLGSSLLDIQCLFFASVFERYALRPLSAWYYIQMACTRLQVHLMRKRNRTVEPGTSRNGSAHHLEQRVFWTCFKAESELTPEIGLRPSSLRDFAYPDLFPTPPATTTLPHIELENASVSYEDFNTVDESRSWQFYLAEISLRRTIDDTLWLFYHQGEEHWLKNTDLLVQQYAETDEQISLWYSQLSKSFDHLQHPNDEYSFFLQSRFLDWRETALRPLLYIFLHDSSSPPRHDVLELSREAVSIAADIVLRCDHHHRHGGTWLIARKAFLCALLILAVVVKNGEVKPPPEWHNLIRIALKTLERWSSKSSDIQLMREVLEKVFASVWQIKS